MAVTPLRVAPIGEQSDNQSDAPAHVAQGRARHPRDMESFGRLMSVDRAAAYLGVSEWLVKQFIIDGSLQTTELPRPRTASAVRSGARRPIGEVLRLVLIDRRDLDAFVDEHGRKARR